MRFMEFLSKRKVLANLTLSHMLVLFVTLFASLLFYIKSVGIIDESIDRQRIDALTQFKSFVDMHLENIKMLGSQIELNTDVIAATRYIDRDITSQTWTNKRIADYMEQITMSNSFIKRVGVYLPQAGIMVTNNGTYYPELWHKTFLSDKSINYNEFKRGIDKLNRSEFYIMSGNSEKNSEKVVLYMDSLTPRAYDRQEGTIFIIFDFASLKTPIESLNVPNYFVLDNKKSSLFSRDQVLINGIAENTKLNGDNSEFTQKVILPDKVMYIVTQMKSSINEWEYVSAIPYPEYEKRLAWMKGLALFCIVISLSIGLFIAIYFSRNNYKKLLSITGLFGGGAIKPAGDEYNYIREHIREMISEQVRMTEKVNRQDAILRNVFLNRLLTKKLQNDNDSIKLYESLEMDPVNNKFAVMLIDTEHFESDLMDAKLNGKDYGFVPGIISYIVQNAMENELGLRSLNHQKEQKSIKYRVLSTEINGLTACLLLLPADISENAPEIPGVIKGIAESLRERLQEELGSRMSISLSRVHKGFSECNAAYNEALDVMEYIRLIGISAIIDSEELKSRIDFRETYYDSSNELFMNCIKAEDFNEAKILVDEIFTQYVSGNKFAPIQFLKSRMISFSNAFLGAISELGASVGKDIFDYLKPSNRLFNCRSILDMKKELYQLIDELAEYIESIRNAEDGKMRSDILDYIEKNLANNNLSVTNIAEYFGFTQCQLSRYFKKEFDMGILEYIHNRRLNKVKKLIGEGISLNEAAEKTGFYNDAALIRVFKKYEKITPGKFRDKIISRKTS